MARPLRLDELSAEEQTELEMLLAGYERACRDGTAADLAEYVPLRERLSLVALAELVKVDLEVRWRSKRPVLAEDYLVRYPALAAVPALWPDLLYEEYFVRQRHGDQPALTEYAERFPECLDLVAELQRLVRERPRSVIGRRSDPQSADVAVPRTLPPSRRASAGPQPFPAAAGMARDGGGAGNGYEFLKRIGAGSFGEVWRARAPGGVEVAIKVLLRPLSDAQAQREREALDLIKNLRHPFVLQTHAYWIDQDRLYIAMELADGSLRDRLRECVKTGQRGIPVDELLRYTRQACEALDFLHGQQVLHRDVKPDNLLLLQRYVKLADMGLARHLEGKAQFTATTAGSLAYMAPEVWSGQASTASDQYSLAAAYVELRQNRLLFDTQNMQDLMLGHREHRPDLSALQPGEQAVLHRALAKRVDNRFPSCTAFWEALHQAFTSPAPKLPRRVEATVGGRGGSGTLLPDEWHEQPGALPDPVDPENDPELVIGTIPEVKMETDPAIPVPSALRKPPVRRRVPPRRPVQLLLAGLLLTLALGILGVGSAFFLAPSRTLPGPTAPTSDKVTAKELPPPVVSRPPAEPPLVSPPPDFGPATGAAKVLVRGRFFWNRLVRNVDPSESRSCPVFLLIDNVPAAEQPFYLMEHKVTNRLYRRFLPAAAPVPPKMDDCPVYSVNAPEAYQFAVRLLDRPGVGRWKANLPTQAEWDLASGLSEQHPSVLRTPELVAGLDASAVAGARAPSFGGAVLVFSAHLLKRTPPVPPGMFAFEPHGPWDVFDYGLDEAKPSGCKNMFSNGWEWTRSEYPGQSVVDLSNALDAKLTLLLRGQTYRLLPNKHGRQNRPLELLADEDELPMRTRIGMNEAPDISFRVVLEPPPPDAAQ